MRKFMLPIVAACLFVVAGSRAPAADSPIDKLIDQLIVQRQAVATAQKAEADTLAALKDAYGALQKRLNELGIGNLPAPLPPTDPLVLKLKTAYAAEPAAVKDKVEAMKDLGELCKACADMAVDPAVLSIQGLATKAAAAAKDLMKGRIPGVFGVFKAEIIAAFPFEAPLTDESRKAAQATFHRIQSALTEAAK